MKVLVVEAEDVVLKATGLMLNKLGYEVGLAPDCDEAFRTYCNRGPYDVVLIRNGTDRFGNEQNAVCVAPSLQR